MAMHTGEAFERGGDYFGPALNRAARLRSLAGADQILLSQAVAELVRDHLPAGAVLRDLGHRELRGLSRGENVYELPRHGSDTARPSTPRRGGRLPSCRRRSRRRSPGRARSSAGSTSCSGSTTRWERPRAGDAGAVLHRRRARRRQVAAGGRARRARRMPRVAVVLYGRCDEDLAAPLPAVHRGAPPVGAGARGATGCASVRGVDELAACVPELAELLPARRPGRPRRSRHRAAGPVRRGRRSCCVAASGGVAGAAGPRRPALGRQDDPVAAPPRPARRGDAPGSSSSAPTATPSWPAPIPLAATLADLAPGRRRHADLARRAWQSETSTPTSRPSATTTAPSGGELAEITSGNPFFLIEVLRHVEETGGTWTTGDRCPKACGRPPAGGCRGCRTPTNEALSVAAVVGTTFDLALVEQVRRRTTSSTRSPRRAAPAWWSRNPGSRPVPVRPRPRPPGAAGRARHGEAGAAAPHDRRAPRRRAHRRRPRRPPRRPRLPLVRMRVARAAPPRPSTPAGGPPSRPWSASPTRRPATSTAWPSRRSTPATSADDDARAELHLARCDALLAAGDVAAAPRARSTPSSGRRHGSERLGRLVQHLRGPPGRARRTRPARPRSSRSIGAAADAMRARRRPPRRGQGPLRARPGARAPRPDRRRRARPRRGPRRRSRCRRPRAGRRHPRRGAAWPRSGARARDARQRPLPRRRPGAAASPTARRPSRRSRSAARRCSRRCAAASTPPAA